MTFAITETHPLGNFPQGSHDSWQFHFYAPEICRFFSVRMWASNSVRQAWAWTSSLDPADSSVIAHLSECEFRSEGSRETSATCLDASGVSFNFTELSNLKHDGVLSVSVMNHTVLNIKFNPRKVCFWNVPGQTDGVFHFPNLSASIEYENKVVKGFGYCKRYWGDYDGPWGYQFIQGGADDEKTFFWTADATFGDDEYNYFKVLNGETGSIIQADKTDTYHNNQRAFWRPLEGAKFEAELTECAKMEFFLTSDKQHSKLVERFGRVQLKKDGKVVFNGFGFNEICFGTVA
jgi:hypothetical protein